MAQPQPNGAAQLLAAAAAADAAAPATSPANGTPAENGHDSDTHSGAGGAWDSRDSDSDGEGGHFPWMQVRGEPRIRVGREYQVDVPPLEPREAAVPPAEETTGAGAAATDRAKRSPGDPEAGAGPEPKHVP